MNYRNKQAFLPSELHPSTSSPTPIKQKHLGREFKELFQFNDGTTEVL